MSKRKFFELECEASDDSGDESDVSDVTTESMREFIVADGPVEDTQSSAETHEQRSVCSTPPPRYASPLIRNPLDYPPVSPTPPVVQRSPPGAPVAPRVDPAGGPPGNGRQRSRRFALTLNNPTAEEKAAFEALDVRFKCYGIEGETEGRTPHLQAYLELPRNRLLTILGLKRVIEVANERAGAGPSRYHIEVARSDGKVNYQYCRKEGGYFFEEGERPKGVDGETRGQGKRSDLDRVSEMVKNGDNIRDIAIEKPGAFIRYHKGIVALMSTINFVPRTEPTLGYWCWGPTKTGKSRWAYSLSPESTYVKDPATRFFCRYAQEETVIIDDFRPNKDLPFSFLLRLCDRYPMMVQYKSVDSVQFNSRRIVVTCPLNIQEAFAHLDFMKDGDIAQLKRRFVELEFGPGKLTHHLTIAEAEERRAAA